MSTMETLKRLMAEREAAVRREFTASPDGSFDAALDELDREESTRTDTAIFPGQEAERVGGQKGKP